MKSIVIISLLFFLNPMISFGQSINQKSKLEFLWETDTLLTTVESVIYDQQTGLIYSSNIEGSPANKDGVGSISQIDLEGNIINRDWIKGLNAPKGMDIHKGSLFVTDIDQLHEINITTGKILKSYQVEGASFLNDVAISQNGTVYFSESDKNKIFYLKEGKIDILMDFDSPNGLFVENNHLLVVSWGKKTFSRVNLDTKKINLIASEILDPDGIESISDNAFLVSSWGGMIHYVNNDGVKNLLLDTRDSGIYAADIDYILEKKILLIPSFFHNTVRAYQYSYE